MIFGATSAIAHAAARLWVKRGHAVFLVGRDPHKLAAMAAEPTMIPRRQPAPYSADRASSTRPTPLLCAAGDFGFYAGQGLDQFGAKWYVLGQNGNKIDDD